MDASTSGVALITGSGRGLGLAIAERLFRDGYSIVLTDIDEEGVQTALRGFPVVSGQSVVGLPLDVTDDDSVAEVFHEVDRTLGGLDVLVNNAGIISRVAAEQIDSAAWERELDVHLGGAMRCSRSGFALLKRSHRPSIVNMASVGSTFGLPLRLAYSTAKSGLVGLTRTLATEWGSYGIRVNAIAPGYMDTAMLQTGLATGVLDERRLIDRTPLGRFGQAEEIAGAASFLVSSDASFITGTVLNVDGGLTIDGTFHLIDAG